MKYAPNIITFAGIVCTMLATWLVNQPVQMLHSAWIVVLFCLGQACDVLDGAVARRLGLTSVFGADFDLTADRILYHIMAFTAFGQAWFVAAPFMIAVQVRSGRNFSGRAIMALYLAISVLVFR